MDKLIIHREGQAIGWHDYLSLRALPGQEERPLRSFGGMTVGSIRLRALLDGSASPYLTFHSGDGYSTTLPWTSLDDCVVAYRLDLRALPRRLGGPYRVFIVGANPRSCLKYVEGIELGVQPKADVHPSCHHDHDATVDYLD